MKRLVFRMSRWGEVLLPCIHVSGGTSAGVIAGTVEKMAGISCPTNIGSNAANCLIEIIVDPLMTHLHHYVISFVLGVGLFLLAG